MSGRIDILDQRENLRNPFAGSVLFHAGVFALLAGWGIWGSRVEQWGDPKALGGGAVAITPVSGIKMPPREGRVNPVANDTESAVPSAPAKPEPKRAPKEDPDSIALKTKRLQKKQTDIAAARQKYTADKDRRPNQVYSTTGQAAVSPMFTQAPGSGSIGSGSGIFGTRFGYYEQLLREKVARNWQSEDIGARAAPPVTVRFEILRSGVARSIQVAQGSGNFTLDQSALRAITVSSPFPPLPGQYEHDSVVIEFTFRLQK